MEKIIVAPREMHKNLLSISRKDDFFVNPKILTKEEFLEKCYGKISEEGLYYLLKNKDIIYDNLIEMARYIPRSNDNCIRPKNRALYDWKVELLKENLIDRDEFFEQFIKNKEFEIYGYSQQDDELLSLLNIYRVNHSFVDFSKGNSELCVKKFPLLEDEIFYMLNEIAGLLDKGVSPNDIYIYTSNENAIFYINKFYKSFGFEINFPNQIAVYSQECVSTFLLFCHFADSFEEGFAYIDKLNVPMPSDIKILLEELCNVDLEFNKKMDYISSYLKSKKMQNPRYENAVNIISKPIFEENKYIFIPCFAQNIYPKSYKDDEYISDNDKKELGVLTSLQKCRIESEISEKFLLSNNIFMLSKSSASFSERYFDSPFVNLLNIKTIDIKDLPKKIYSKQYAEYRLGIDKDNELYFLQHSKCLNSLEKQITFNYRTYDNKYSNALAVSPNDFLKLSYSSVSTYFKCPFSYYLDKILKLDENEDTFYTKFGKVAHYVFEHQYDDDFDFETTFDAAKNKETWEPEEELFVERLKNNIKDASDACLLHYKTYASNPKVFTEIVLKTKIDANTLLEGTVDKVMIFNDSEAMIVDYKTGSETFDRKKLEYGLSLQLPTYAYLFNNEQEFKDYHITGLYINNVINNSYTTEKDDDEIIDSFLKLNGVTVANTETIEKMDASISNGKSFFIKGITIKNGVFRKNNSLVGDEELKEMAEFALDKYAEAADRIRNNDFEISPLSLGGNTDACKFCKYKDICFVKKSQKRGKNEDDEESGEEGNEVV